VYAGGSDKGIFIIDATDPKNPFVANQLSVDQIGGFKVGPVFAIGNLLVAINLDRIAGMSTFDISDPKNPLLLATSTNNATKSYTSIVNGNRSYFLGPIGVTVFDFSDPTNLIYLGGIEARGGAYGTIQDDIIHMGTNTTQGKDDSRSGYYKIDPRNPRHYADAIVSNLNLRALYPNDDYHGDFAAVMGNLIVLGDDKTMGCLIFPHQQEPDLIPPKVNMINPKSKSTGMALSSRIGMSFTDRIDIRSVSNSTFVVRPLGGTALKGNIVKPRIS